MFRETRPTILFRPLERYDWHLAPPHQNEKESMATKLQGKILKQFVDSLLSSTFEFAFSFLAILTHFAIFLFIAHFLFWVKIGDQGACAGVYWIWGAQYVKISPEITQFCNFSISNLRFNLLKGKTLRNTVFSPIWLRVWKLLEIYFPVHRPQPKQSQQIEQIGYNLWEGGSSNGVRCLKHTLKIVVSIHFPIYLL